MQEIVIFLSSVAGVATAAALRKIPRPKKPILSIGANSHIKSQLHSLSIEKEILTKTISRLYQTEASLSKIQRDRLLIRYQHQLGIVLAKMEKLEEASKHPDLGPVGDGLITLMDQKLSQLDNRLYELSSKITIANAQVPKVKQKPQEPIKKSEEELHPKPQIQNEIPKERLVTQEIDQHKPRSFEITTLTEIPTKVTEFPFFDHKRKQSIDLVREQIEKPQPQIDEKIEILQSSVGSTVEKSQITPELPKINESTEPVEKKPKPIIKLPEEEKFDEDEDDLDKIKGEIMKTLSKLEQAEVE